MMFRVISWTYKGSNPMQTKKSPILALFASVPRLIFILVLIRVSVRYMANDNSKG